MNPNGVAVPVPDPMGLPGPVWLMTALLLVTFTVHVIFMNAAFGGGLWTLWNYLRGRNSDHPYSRRLSLELSKALPVLLAYTISFGVAALLFVQVLYGRFLYASSILIGAVWIMVIPLVIMAYYGYYYVSHTADKGKLRTGLVMGGSLLCLMTIAFIFSNNMTLMLRPDRWLSMYRAHPNGWNLNVGEPSLVPRYLHMLVGAVAVFSAILAHIGMRKMKLDFEYGRWIVRRAATVFAAAVGVQFLLGMWLLLSQERRVAMMFITDPLAGSVLGLALLGVVASVVLMLVGAAAERPSSLVHAGFAMTLVTVGLMVTLRHLLRLAYLRPYLQQEVANVHPQTSVIILFLALFVGGLITVSYMLWKVQSAKSNSDTQSRRVAHV
jgi:hypothetical protein